jgi:acyl-CoA synthetase (AMP-forming)/AMP-acid ligase II
VTSPADLFNREYATLGEVIRIHAAARPEADALICGEQALSWDELDRRMDRVAAALRRDEVAPREAIAICASNSIAYATVFLGALRAGVAVAPLPQSATPASLARMALDSGAKLLFLDEAAGRHMAGGWTGRTIALDGSATGEAFESWLAPDGAAAEPVEVAPDWAFNIIYSSGTTGEPKGIVQSHAMRWTHIRRGLAGLYDAASVTLVSTPLCSNTTLVSVAAALAGGGALVLMEKFDAVRFLELAGQRRVTHAMLVPVQYRRILAVPDFDRYDLTSFRMKFTTSAPFDAAMKAEVLRRWPGGLTEYFGMTEGGCTFVLYAHERPDKLHTVGQPAPGGEFRLLDDEGRDVARGEIGEIVGRSLSMMTGYLNQPEKTAAFEWRDEAGRRFFRSGDVGRLDEDGFLVLMDRKKDMIISGGFNVYPSDIEAELMRNEAILEAAVVGVPSRAWGETPIGVVALKPGAGAAAEDLRAWINARVGKTQRLAALQIVDSLPRSAIGKVLKRELRDQYAGLAGD